jgi:hypothetical protein
LQKTRTPQLQGVQGFGCSRLRPILDNEEDVVSSAFPEGKQLGCFFGYLDVTCREFQETAQRDRKHRLFLLLAAFSQIVYATLGYTLPPIRHLILFCNTIRIVVTIFTIQMPRRPQKGEDGSWRRRQDC